jgi:hypothetical protein
MPAANSAKVNPPAIGQIRYEILGWVGAVGTALTLLNSISPLLRLADWARYIVEHWGQLVAAPANG